MIFNLLISFYRSIIDLKINIQNKSCSKISKSIFSTVSNGEENICKLNDLKIEVWRNYVVGSNDKLIILSTLNV